MSELFREALRRYMPEDAAWESLLERTRAKGAAMGVNSEEDVERMADEHRRNKRELG